MSRRTQRSMLILGAMLVGAAAASAWLVATPKAPADNASGEGQAEPIAVGGGALGVERSVPSPVPTTTAAAVGGRVESSTVLHVARSGGAEPADGSAAAPFSSIGEAVAAASAGTTIEVGTGVYRERVEIAGKAVRLVAAPGATAVVSGADLVTNWGLQGQHWWTTAPPVPEGEWPAGMLGADQPTYAALVVFDGSPLESVGTRAELAPGAAVWDRDTNRIWIADDPEGHIVEVGVRHEAIRVDEAPGTVISGIEVRHHWAAPGDRGAIEIRSNDVTLHGLDVHHNASAGIQVIGGFVVVDGVRSHHNGRLGLNAHQADALVVRSSAFDANNTAGFFTGGAAGGLKVTASRDVSILDSAAAGNDGAGLWIDMSSVGVDIRNNEATANTRAGIFVEVSADVRVVDNLAVGNDRGIEINESNDVAVTGNEVRANTRGIFVVDGWREGETCTDHRIESVYRPPTDQRFGCQWPLVTWNIERIEIRGNRFVDGNPDDPVRSMLEIHHVADPDAAVGGVDLRRPASQMQVVTSDNEYVRVAPGLPRWTVAWTQGQSMSAFEDLADFQTATGQGSGSTQTG